jgi:hypothetical protein
MESLLVCAWVVPIPFHQAKGLGCVSDELAPFGEGSGVSGVASMGEREHREATMAGKLCVSAAVVLAAIGLHFFVDPADVAGRATGPGQPKPEAVPPLDDRLQPYLKVLQEQGQEPVRFVLEKLASHDLIIFDDGLHSALEPFEFYQQLIRDRGFQRQAPAIFLEAVPINQQRHLDAYLSAANDDPRLLYPAFQEDHNGKGWNYQTYFELLRTVRAVNQTLPDKGKLKVYGVCFPTYWPQIQTHQDLVQYKKSSSPSCDHHLYAAIRNELAEFKEKRKGVFLTNTRHAYKGLRSKDGQFFWNAATFIHQWHPGKAYSIRVHNVTIQAVRSLPTGSARTFEGQVTHEYKHVRMARGLWDSAFRAADDRPVAFPLQGNVFGKEPFTGPDQLDALPGQKMQDAYDAVIFLAPLEKLRHCALVDLYTPAFKQEMKRRYRLMLADDQLAEVLKKTRTKSYDEMWSLFVEKSSFAQPVRPLPEAQLVGPIDEWKTPSKE